MQADKNRSAGSQLVLIVLTCHVLIISTEEETSSRKLPLQECDLFLISVDILQKAQHALRNL